MTCSDKIEKAIRPGKRQILNDPALSLRVSNRPKFARPFLLEFLARVGIDSRLIVTHLSLAQCCTEVDAFCSDRVLAKNEELSEK